MRSLLANSTLSRRVRSMTMLQICAALTTSSSRQHRTIRSSTSYQTTSSGISRSLSSRPKNITSISGTPLASTPTKTSSICASTRSGWRPRSRRETLRIISASLTSEIRLVCRILNYLKPFYYRNTPLNRHPRAADIFHVLPGGRSGPRWRESHLLRQRRLCLVEAGALGYS